MRTIEAIHKRFDIAGERLLAQAKRIIANAKSPNADKVERLKALGFGATKPIKEMQEREKAVLEAHEMIEAIEYYRIYYPSYKFISTKQIQSICKKYGLLYGDSKNYLGDIPDKNLEEIEAFKLREEDYYKEESWLYNFGLFMPSPRLIWNNESGHITWVDDSVKEKEKKEEDKIAKPPFKICAHKKEFNTAGYEIKDGYKLVYDPIVIQPVKFKNIEGGLIISKWGLPEDANKELSNPINN